MLFCPYFFLIDYFGFITEKIVLLQQQNKGKQIKFLFAAAKNFAAATKRFVDRTKHFVVVTTCFCYPYFVSITKPFFSRDILFTVQPDHDIQSNPDLAQANNFHIHKII